MNQVCSITAKYQKREAICALPFPVIGQGSTPSPSLTNLFTCPLCFTAYTFCDVTSQLFSLKGGGSLDPKNPDLYYYIISFDSNPRVKFLLDDRITLYHEYWLGN